MSTTAQKGNKRIHICCCMGHLAKIYRKVPITFKYTPHLSKRGHWPLVPSYTLFTHIQHVQAVSMFAGVSP